VISSRKKIGPVVGVSGRLWFLLTKELPGPYTQRICVPRYWPVNTLETQRINPSTAIKFAFYAYRRHQPVIYSLNSAFRTTKPQRQPRSQLKLEAIERARQWKALIGTNGIEPKADLARYLGISRARITQVLKRLSNCSFNNHLRKKK
jgi:hypothetical protein